MDALLLLFFGYVLSKAFSDDDHKRRHRSKRRNNTFCDDSSYSAYDTWRKSHGDQNTCSDPVAYTNSNPFSNLTTL